MRAPLRKGQKFTLRARFLPVWVRVYRDRKATVTNLKVIERGRRWEITFEVEDVAGSLTYSFSADGDGYEIEPGIKWTPS